MTLNGISIMQSALESATPACRPGIKRLATRTSGKSRHFLPAYKRYPRVRRTTGKNRSGLVRYLLVRRSTKPNGNRRPMSSLQIYAHSKGIAHPSAAEGG